MPKEKDSKQKQAELNARVKGFNEEIIALLEKYRLALMATPFIHEGKVLARPQVIDDDELKASREAQGKKQESEIKAA